MPVAETTHLSLRSRPPRRTVWAWLRDMGHSFERGHATVPTGVVKVGEACAVATSQAAAVAHHNAVLPFPARGEVLLAQLASALRGQFAGQGSADDPLLFTISRGRPPRLTIDRIAHVEFHQHGRAFHLAVEAGPDTTLLLESADIDIIIGFVARYIGEKLGERARFEVAP